MSTLEALKRLPDGSFHRLGDDLLRRFEPRYRRLRPHGINERGQSIKGQPDSYVGDTANTCKIAVCYTTEKSDWWNKVRDDVGEALAASPSVKEIVAIVPRNADRDGPKDKSIDWLSRVEAAAGTAVFRFFDGRDLALLLDADYQDLRHDHLGIPYSRLTAASILASGRRATATVLQAVRTSGRYDPDRYAPRSADRELFTLWQSCLREQHLGHERTAPLRMLALVNDSGVGKTSLVCAFVESLCEVLPVLLVQARDLAFDSQESLVAHAIHALQGVLDPGVRVNEERALTRHLADAMPLTLVVDGLDETHEPDRVRKAITFWLQSRLGQKSVLLVASRPEFWRVCFDPYWKQWMPTSLRNDRAPGEDRGFAPASAMQATGETRLPDRFSNDELEGTWTRAGRTLSDLYGLRAEVREELQHPFTLRAYLEAYAEDARPSALTRSDVLETWLNRRLDTEARPGERITPQLLQESLRLVAMKIDAARGGSVSVDELTDAPRFDPAHPPGPVVQRLIDANILETLPGKSDRIRFAAEAVQDFYRADLDVAAIHEDASAMATQLADLRFTDAYPRLVRIGRQLGDDECRHRFLDEHLAEMDVRMAATVLAVYPFHYRPELRAKVTRALGQELCAAHRIRAAFAITMLGALACPEAVATLEGEFLPESPPRHAALNRVAAEAFVKLSAPAAAEFVYRWEWLQDYYFPEKLALFRRSQPEFKCAVADYAQTHLASPSGTPEHMRAVSALAYLGDARLVEHLRARLSDSGILEEYENHALVALGTEPAAALFALAVDSVNARLSEIPDDGVNHDKRSRLFDTVEASKADVHHLVTPVFAEYLLKLIESEERLISWVGTHFARRARIAPLIYATVVASTKHERWHDIDPEHTRSIVPPDLWLGWWQRCNDLTVRKALLKVLPLYPTASVETILVDCLELAPMRAEAARALGDYASVRVAPLLRKILEEDPTTNTWWDRLNTADALGRLRDQGAIPVLRSVAASDPNGDVAGVAITSLGFIGSSEAEAALCELLHNGIHHESVVESLLLCGTCSAISVAVAEAKKKPHGWRWLCERLGHCSWRRGWRRGEYHMHIQTSELVEYVDANWEAGTSQENWDIVHWFREIDSPDVRNLLLKWANRRGTDQDPLVRESDEMRMSASCLWELADRGDEPAIPFVLDSVTQDDQYYVHFVTDRLQSFSSVAAASEIKRRLSNATDNAQIGRMLALLGRFGQPADGEMVRPFLNHSDHEIAELACEALLRLTDPLLVPEHW